MPRAQLLKNLDKFKEAVKGRDVSLFLDYDGTLTPIAPTPAEAFLSHENKFLLEQLAKSPRCRVAIVSGRALADVRSRVGLKNVTYAGNHGFEIDGPHIHFESFCSPDLKSVLDKVKSELVAGFSDVKGVLIEDKGLTISVHYRLVEADVLPFVKKTFDRVCKVYQQEKKIKIFPGKKVMEVRPAIVWDKGAAVLWLLKQHKLSNRGAILPVYIGDDITDEDAFEVLRGKGTTILVNDDVSVSSWARYCLQNTQEVTVFLKEMVELLKAAT